MKCSIKNLKFKYDKDILNDISFDIFDFEIVGLIGLNGCGKTTLFNCLTKRLKYQGDIYINDLNIKDLNAKEMSKYMSYIPQNSSITNQIDVIDVVLMGLNNSLKIFENPKKEDKLRAIELLNKININPYRDYLSLSGGEKKLVLFIRSILADSKILLLDEPEANLDLNNKYEVLKILKDLVSNNKTALISIHDPSVALMFCNRILLMKDGKIIDDFKPANLSEEELNLTLSKIYNNIIVRITEISNNRYYQVFPKVW